MIVNKSQGVTEDDVELLWAPQWFFPGTASASGVIAGNVTQSKSLQSRQIVNQSAGLNHSFSRVFRTRSVIFLWSPPSEEFHGFFSESG
ncbi:hypothetical protein CB1_000444008 [Camelus ferus]|nr:hypothetical protein CB1_000444008 [Camelus ferus]